MPKPSKRAVKSSAPSTSASPIPSPFGPAPKELLPLLDTLSTDRVYILHLDRHPPFFKRRIFSIPVFLNLTILLLLLWRVYAEVPFYYGLLMSALGHHNDLTIDTASSTWRTIITQVFWRATNFMVDWACARIFAPWPWTFFVEGPGNPVSWRWNIGFRDVEVYVRVSRGWGRDELLGATREEDEDGEVKVKKGGKAGGESPFFKVRILPAVEKQRVKSKTGYLLMDKDWDLDFAAMVRAHKLLDKGALKEENLEKSVFVWVPAELGEERVGQWAIWDCWKLDEGSETEARKRIVQFKDRLTAMGKENLFFKWVELVQYESSQPGGMTRERQEGLAEKAKLLFAEQGVDFEEFVQSIGGVEGFPGMEGGR